MARPWRIQCANAMYHVMSRGVAQGEIFYADVGYRKANLSRAMQWLQTSYSIYFNRRYRRSGHLFQGRYKSILVGENAYWRGLSFSIHLNPVRAGMIKELEEYAWSSYHDYVKTKKIHHWVSCKEILKVLDAVARYFEVAGSNPAM